MKKISIAHVTFFAAKDETRRSDNKRYLGFVSFLCQVFGNVRLATGDTMKPLVVPVYDCLEQILNDQSSNEDEYECFSIQVHRELFTFKQDNTCS